MGWLFGKKKKVPKVPFPEPLAADEQSLRLPGSRAAGKVIEPEQVRKAAGVEDFPAFPELEDETPTETAPAPPRSFPPPKPAPLSRFASFRPARPVPTPEAEASKAIPSASFGPRPVLQRTGYGSRHVKVDTYRQILGEIESIRDKAGELGEINKKLGSSEYNESTNFAKLRRAMKAAHDRLLVIDKTVFRSE